MAGGRDLARSKRCDGRTLATSEGFRLGLALEAEDLKLVVAMAPRSYREAIGMLLREVRRSLDVSVVDPPVLEAEIVRFDPDVVFSSRPYTPSKERWPAWLTVHPDASGQAVTFYLDGEYSEIENINLEDLLSIVDRTERSLAGSFRANRP